MTLCPENVEASIGLQQCKVALGDMKVCASQSLVCSNLNLLQSAWPSASRAWDLLNGAHVSVNRPSGASYTDPGYQARSKRHAEDAFGHEEPVYPQQEAFVPSSGAPQHAPTNQSGVQDLGTRMMAHMLGLDIPDVEPSTTFFPGYEWWPRTSQDQLGDIRLSGTALPVSEASARSSQIADSSMLPTLEMTVPSMNQGALEWAAIPRQSQPQPQPQQPRRYVQGVGDPNLNYNYQYQNYGV